MCSFYFSGHTADVAKGEDVVEEYAEVVDVVEEHGGVADVVEEHVGVADVVEEHGRVADVVEEHGGVVDVVEEVAEAIFRRFSAATAAFLHTEPEARPEDEASHSLPPQNNSEQF